MSVSEIARIITKSALRCLLFMLNGTLASYINEYNNHNMHTNTNISVCIMQQYLVPAMKDRMKYLRNYDGSRKSVKAEEETTELGPPPKKAKVFKKEQWLKAPAVPSLPLGEDGASHARNVKFLQAEEKKVNPNKQVILSPFW